MKVTVLALTLPLAMVTAACQTTNPVPPTPSPIVKVLPENVQAIILKSCGLVVSTSDVQRLVVTFRPELESIFSFVQSICDAATTRGWTMGNNKVHSSFRGVAFSAVRRRDIR